MADLKLQATVSGQVTITLTESEARALDALVGYGDDAFLNFFYQHMGRHYMQPHEAGLRSLFRSVRSVMPYTLSRLTVARAAFDCPSPNEISVAVARIAQTERQRRIEVLRQRRERDAGGADG